MHRRQGWGRKACRAGSGTGRLHAGGHDSWIGVSGEGGLLQGLNKFSHTLVALLGVHGQSFEEDTLYLRRYGRIEDAGRYQFVPQAAIDRQGRSLHSQQEIHCSSHGIDIRPRAGLADILLDGAEALGNGFDHGLCIAIRIVELREAKIDQHGSLVGSENDVAWLDVTMNYRGSTTMQFLQ